MSAIPRTSHGRRHLGSAPAARPRNRALDGMRGAVVLSILLYHAWQATEHQSARHTVLTPLIEGLSWAVGWFFIVSGTLLFKSYAGKVLRDERNESTKSFALRRLMRVLPPYWVAIVVVWSARNFSFPGDSTDLWKHLTLTHVFDNERIFYTIGPAWSLTTQVLVYVFLALLWRPLAKACKPLGQNGRTALLAVPGLLLIAAGAAYQVWAVRFSGAAGDDWVTWFHPLAQAPAVGLGMTCGLALARWNPRIENRTAQNAVAVLCAGLLAGLVWWAWAHPISDPVVSMMTFRALSTVVAMALVLSVLTIPSTSWYSRMWSWKPLAFLGPIAFGIYLWHESLLLLLTATGFIDPKGSVWPAFYMIAVLGTVAGFLAYHLIEVPMGNVAELIAPRDPFHNRYEKAYETPPSRGSHRVSSEQAERSDRERELVQTS